jgi:penicillin amidase
MSQKRSKGGPSSRRVIDFSDIENSWTICLQDNQGIRLVRITTTTEIYNAGILEK